MWGVLVAISIPIFTSQLEKSREATDLANIRLNLLGLYNFNYYQSVAGDTNKDGKITIADLANIRLHLLGLYTIK